jgi:hypothetical protein
MKLRRICFLLLALYFTTVSAEGLSYTWADNALTGTEAIAATGYVEVSFQNNSTQPYEIVFDRLQEGKTPDDHKAALIAISEAFRNPENLPVAFKNYYETVEAIGGVSASPHSSGSAGVIILKPGTYVISPTCGGGGCPPSSEGSLVLTVSEGASADAPTPDLTVKLSEFRFEGLPDELSAGKYLWEMSNVGQQSNFLEFFKLAEGKTQDGFLAWMTSSMSSDGPSGPPPGERVGGSHFLTGGQRYYQPLELSPGRYVAFCPVPDITSGKPQYLLGMIQMITVK